MMDDGRRNHPPPEYDRLPRAPLWLQVGLTACLWIGLVVVFVAVVWVFWRLVWTLVGWAF